LIVFHLFVVGIPWCLAETLCCSTWTWWYAYIFKFSMDI